MTRRLLALFAPGLLMAQTKAKPHYTTGRMCLATEADDCQAQRPRPRNGQCPVCGTMAPAFKPNPADYKGCAPCPPDSNVCLSVCRPWSDADMPTSRRTDCDHCNTTFRQWAEGKEPKR